MTEAKLALLLDYVGRRISAAEQSMKRKRNYDNDYLQGAADEIETVLIDLNFIREFLTEIIEEA